MADVAETRDVVDADAVQAIAAPVIGNEKQSTVSLVGSGGNIVESDVVDAVAGAAGCFTAVVGKNGGDLHARGRVTHFAIADGHISYQTSGAQIAVSMRVGLVLGRQQQGVPLLAESPPRVLGDVAFKQHALSILEFEVVFDDKRIAVVAAHKAGLSGHPDHWLEEMVVPNF